MLIDIENPPGKFKIKGSQKLIRQNNPSLDQILRALHTKLSLNTRAEYLRAIGRVYADGVIGTTEEKRAASIRRRVEKKYHLKSLIAGETIPIPPDELPTPKQVLVYFTNKKQEGVVPEDIASVEIRPAHYGKDIPIRTVTIKAEKGDRLDLRIWVTFMLDSERIISDPYFSLPDSFFNNLTARKLEKYETLSQGGDPYTFPSRKSGCDHFITVYPVRKSRAGNEYRILELGWRTSPKGGWKWSITAAGGSSCPEVNPWIMTSHSIRFWRIRRYGMTIENAVDAPKTSKLIQYDRDMYDVDVTPLVKTSIMDHIMERTGAERRGICEELFKAGHDCVPAYCSLCVHNRMPKDWETANNDRLDGGLWSQGHPLIQRQACLVKDKFLDWNEVTEANLGIQEPSGTVATRKGSQVWIAGRWKVFSTDEDEAYTSGLDYSTYWEDKSSDDDEEYEEEAAALADPSAPYNDTVEEGIELDYDEENWRGEERLSTRFGTHMSFWKRGTEWDSIHDDEPAKWVSKKLDDEISLTLGELTDDDPNISRLDIAVGLRSEFQDAYSWIQDQVTHNVRYCNLFHGKSPGSIGYNATSGYAALNKYSFGSLLKCKMRNVSRKQRSDHRATQTDMPDMFCAFSDSYEEV